jgi:hypothetical protein
LGARGAVLIARARTDSDFARECIDHMSDAAMQLFARECAFSAQQLWQLGLHPGLKKCPRTRRLLRVAR